MIHLVVVSLMAAQDDFAAELKNLTAEYQKAETEYRKDAKRDPAKHPAGTYIPKFNDLAKRATGTAPAVQALLQVMKMAGRNNKNEAAVQALEALMDGYLESPLLEPLPGELRFAARTIGQKACAAALRKILDKSPHKNVQAAAAFALALSILESRPSDKAKIDEAKTLLKGLAETSYAKEADAYLFELENLQVGMTAPDFETTDQDGKSFKLSDYRGKVVIVDFWGFW